METHSLRVGQQKDLPGGAVVTWKGQIERKAIGSPTTITLLLSFGTGVASGLVASWLYDKLKGRASTLRIERTVIQINEGEITRIITERIEQP